MIQRSPSARLDSVEIKFGGAGSADSARRLSGWCLLLVDVVEDLVDDIGLCVYVFSLLNGMLDD